jgi:zinc D-Ala-D-Ala carboxypeptidase
LNIVDSFHHQFYSIRTPKKNHLWIILGLAWLLAACSPGPAPAPTASPSPTLQPPAVTVQPVPSQTPEASSPTPSPLPRPSLTPTIPPTLYNRYLGRDATRQPELVKTPPGPIVPIQGVSGYAHSYIAIFLEGRQVNGAEIQGDREALEHLLQLFDAAYGAQHTSETVLSSYRSYAEQVFLGQQDPEANGAFLAEPGRSEHHLGTAFDLAWQTDRLNFYIMNLDPRARAFYNWLKATAQDYGFIFSYPYKSSADSSKNNLLEPYVTEYKAEPWHIRYVGAALAQHIWSAKDAEGRNYLDPLSPIIPQQFLLP